MQLKTNIMKKIYLLYTLVIAFTVLNVKNINAQQIELPSPYEGTWHYANGNELFIVSLWKENDGSFEGYYKKMEYNNGTIGNTIFNSRKVYNNGAVFPSTIYGSFYAGNGISGSICDNTMENNPEDCKSGRFEMLIIEDNCGNCPLTATWKVEEVSGLRVDFIPGFSIPTDVILTKVSNDIDVD